VEHASLTLRVATAVTVAIATTTGHTTTANGSQSRFRRSIPMGKHKQIHCKVSDFRLRLVYKPMMTDESREVTLREWNLNDVTLPFTKGLVLADKHVRKAMHKYATYVTGKGWIKK
jgi:hypothetical protein